jgi:mediator of replication checkpoint protein 1
MASEPYSPARVAPLSDLSQFELTPTSKVKALLASLDNDSDEENDHASARARLVSAFTKTTKEAPSNASSEPLQKSLGPMSVGGVPKQSNDEEEEDIVRPKGRLAARMLESESNSEESSDQSKKTSPSRTAKTSTTSSSSSTSSTEDDIDAPVVSRKRKVRVPRASTPQPSPRNHSLSPGLFVSPTARRSATTAEHASDSDELPTNPLANDRFKALVEKKRQERLAKEKEAAAGKAKKLAELKRQNAMLDEDEDISDDNVERHLTQQTKPTRKASKRAQEEISRETQRMSRNMQLTHMAITKKKITKASLFARFNYKTTGVADETSSDPPRPTSSSSAGPPSDIEMRETPPTSPASHHSNLEKPVLHGPMAQVALEAHEEEDLFDLKDALNSSPPKVLDKGKGKAVEVPVPELPPAPLFKQRPIRIRPPKMASKEASGFDDSDSDLEIVGEKTPDAKVRNMTAIFDRVPEKKAKESNSLHALRMLAHLTSPGKQDSRKDKKSLMTTSEMQLSLQQRARQQAAREREERLQALRDKGVIVQTAEEREKEMAEVEDLISKARREGEEIKRREKAAAKKERKANGDVDPLGDSSDDEDWKEEKENLAEELSGSDEEGEGSEDDAGDEADGEEDEDLDEENEMELDESADDATLNPMFDDEAGETDDGEAGADLSPEKRMAEADDRAEDEEEDLPVQQRRRRRKTNVVSDDEDEQEQVKETPSALRIQSPGQLHTESPGAPNSVLRSATKTFIPGLSVVGPVGLGLTQIFAGTMDDSQVDISPTAQNLESQDHEDSMAFLRRLPGPQLPDFVPTMSNDSQDVVMDSQFALNHIPESQNDDSQSQPIQLDFSQSQIHGFDSLVHDTTATQLSEMPEATQDVGFQHMTPIRGRFEAPPSTIDTVVLGPTRESEPVTETPIVKKKGKLRRRAPQVAALSDDEEAAEYDEAEPEAEDLEITENVFDVMRKASKKKIIVDEFDKKKSEAKNMVHEQAEESEDEYAGLGGASDDESGDEEDAYVKEIIDDEGGKDVDEHKLAAFFA